MPQQMTFAQVEYAAKKKQTRREQFLAEMEQVLPWAALQTLIRPHYYRETDRGPGHPPIGLERMLRMYLLQQWYSLGDEALEDAVYDSNAFRHFLGIDLSRESVPDATTLLGFRHLLEAKGLQCEIFETINALLRSRGLMMSEGTLVDASIIDAPSSTKNKDKRRDPQMHQTRKGNQWYFGMKAHIGVDMHSGLTHSLTGTAANEADVNQTANLLHGEEQSVYADAGYTGADKRAELKERKLTWRIAMKRGKLKAMDEGPLKEITMQIEHLKSKLRSRVEHPFHVVKNRFGHRKVRYKGLAKNTGQLYVLFALANLVIAKKALLA